MSTGMLAESIWLPTASSRGLISIFLCERVPHVHVDMELILNLNILFIKIFTSDNVICMGMFHRFLGLDLFVYVGAMLMRAVALCQRDRIKSLYEKKKTEKVLL